MSRQQRRAAERAAQKQARRDAAGQPQPATPPSLSEARLTANQANAQLSTGPTTEEGKARSSRNSFKHGLYSKQLVVPSEDPAELDALRDDLFAEHQPATETEAVLVTEMADQYWRLRRFRRYETNLLAEEFALIHMNAIQRMMASAERGFHKALTVLTKLQKERSDEAAPFSELKTQPDQAAPFSEPKIQGGFVPQEQQPESESVRKSASEGGFVSQNDPAPFTPKHSEAPTSSACDAFQQVLKDEQSFQAIDREHGIAA